MAKRTNYCGDLDKNFVDQKVTINGWIDRYRDLGGLAFINIRDKYGITQVIFDPNVNKELHEKACKLRAEWVVSVTGVVKLRAEGMTNKEMKTGEIELHAEELEILSKSETPPFPINGTTDASEELRLKYRFLDIRRGRVAKNLNLRHQVMLEMRQFLSSQDFTEINTPILGKPTPETGAQDYYVPSRIFPGNFFALPQSPQIAKQLLMFSGIDRYFQMAPCFRDEDLRSDRQPEFMQLDLEMSFEEPADLMRMMEEMFKNLFKKHLDVDLPNEFPRIAYSDAVENYGSDRPDLRFGMPLIRLDSIVKECGFKVFSDTVENGGCVKALCLKGGASLSRKNIDGLTEFVKPFGLKGLAFMKYDDGNFSSNIVKFFSAEDLDNIKDRLDVENGDILFFGAADENSVNMALDHLRRKLAKEHNLIPENCYHISWVVDFPMFSRDPETGELQAEHHPFTAPLASDMHLLETDPESVKADAYDLVVNGYELGGGSKRIHSTELQRKVFEILNLSDHDIEERFGFFLNALSYGTPPHLGIAFGIERIIMILAGTDNIRDVIAFPKTTKASDLMFEAPSPVAEEKLQDLAVSLKEAPATMPWNKEE